MKDENKNNPDIIMLVGELKGMIGELKERIEKVEENIDKLEARIYKLEINNQRWYKIITAILMIIGAVLGVNISGVL